MPPPLEFQNMPVSEQDAKVMKRAANENAKMAANFENKDDNKACSLEKCERSVEHISLRLKAESSLSLLLFSLAPNKCAVRGPAWCLVSDLARTNTRHQCSVLR